MTQGLRTLSDSASTGHVWVYETCIPTQELLPPRPMRRETWSVTLETIPNYGYEAGGYLHHILSKRRGHADTTFFLQSRVEEHVDLQLCPFSCRGCHRIDSDEVANQLRQRAVQHGYLGLGSTYRNDVLRTGDPCKMQVVRWTWRQLFGGDLPTNLAATMNAVFALSRRQLSDTLVSNFELVHRAARLVNRSDGDERDERRRDALYGGDCAAHAQWSPTPARGRMLRQRRKLEAVGLEMLWHVVWGANPILDHRATPCVGWWQMEL